MAKIFLDIGGYKGHSSLAALDPIFGFDRIFCFEPCPIAASAIRKINDTRLVVVEAALSNRDGSASLFNSGTLGASLFNDAPYYQREALQTERTTIDIQTIDTARFIKAYTSPGDSIWIKLNCEGSELDIIVSLINADCNTRISNALIDLDAKKIPSLQKKWQGVMELVEKVKLPYSTPEKVQYHMVTNYGGIHNWLMKTNAAPKTPLKKLQSLIYNSKIYLTQPECNGYHKKILLEKFPILKNLSRTQGNCLLRKVSL